MITLFRLAFIPLSSINGAFIDFRPKGITNEVFVQHKRASCKSPIVSAIRASPASDEVPGDNANTPVTKPEVMMIEQLNSKQIAELIEVSFINACLQLSQGFVDVLKLFIVAVKAGFESNLSPNQLVQEVNNCLANTARRQLLPEEMHLRTTWIHAVYLMLEYTVQKNNNDRMIEVDKAVQASYSNVLSKIVQLKKERTNNEKFRPQDFVKENLGPLGLDQTTEVEDPLRFAIVSQTVRLLYFVLVVLEEEGLANDSSADEIIRERLTKDDNIRQRTASRSRSTGFGKSKIPQPPIPRGEGFN